MGWKMNKLVLGILVLFSVNLLAKVNAASKVNGREIVSDEGYYTSEFLSLILTDESRTTEEKKKECRELCLLDFERPSAQLKSCLMSCEKID